jgi:iron(III) transport system ATP-binding protein
MIAVRNVTKRFAQSHTTHPAVDDVSFEVERGLVYALLGPSGCGKTTLLRCLAGIESPDSGTIEIDGRTVYSSDSREFVPVHRRDIGFVFQSYAIWPHMSVFDNVAYPLRYGSGAKPRKDALRERVRAALALVDLEAAIDRASTTLSGGQQQRVALARAIVHEPSVLLMDEPLSNLDARLRQQTRKQLARLLGGLGTTTVYVTHDQIEAMALADVVAVMRDGVILQAASPRELYDRPANRFVANFIGDMNWIDGTVRGADGAHTVVETALGTLRCIADPVRLDGDEVVVGVRPLAISFQGGDPAARNVVHGQVVESTFLGDATSVTVKVGEHALEVFTTASGSNIDGAAVSLSLPPDSCLVYDA